MLWRSRDCAVAALAIRLAAMTMVCRAFDSWGSTWLEGGLALGGRAGRKRPGS